MNEGTTMEEATDIESDRIRLAAKEGRISVSDIHKAAALNYAPARLIFQDPLIPWPDLDACLPFFQTLDANIAARYIGSLILRAIPLLRFLDRPYSIYSACADRVIARLPAVDQARADTWPDLSVQVGRSVVGGGGETRRSLQALVRQWDVIERHNAGIAPDADVPPGHRLDELSMLGLPSCFVRGTSLLTHALAYASADYTPTAADVQDGCRDLLAKILTTEGRVDEM